MKIAWLINIVLPEVADKLGLWKTCLGGWLVGQIKELRKTENKLFVISVSNDVKTVVKVEIENVTYFVIPKLGNKVVRENLSRVLSMVSPEVFHIFGTETEAAAIAMEVFDCRKTVVSIQGLVSVCAKHFCAGIPEKYYRSNTIKVLGKKFFGGSIIEDDVIRLTRCGEKEISLLKSAKYVIGRTSWDQACVKQINSKVRYFSCNEILRPSFYFDEWSVDNCERHSIFLSQSSSPIKGLHQVIEALPLILERYPDTQVYISGSPISEFPTRNKAKQILVEYFCGYQGFIEKLVREKGVSEHIHFLNYLSEEKIKKQFLKANVFVMPSSIENSPNSLGEAMILGVPCVTSCVGGVQSVFDSTADGFMYPFDEPYMLAWCVCKIFESDELANKFSINARKHALVTHDQQKNTNTLIGIYNEIREVFENE